MRPSALMARLGCGAAIISLLGAGNVLALEKVQATAPAAATQHVEFDVFLPLTHRAELDQLLKAQHTAGSASYHQWLTPQQFRQRFGPSQADVAKVSAALQSYGLTVESVHSHGVRVRGPVSSAEAAFATTIFNGFTKSGGRTMVAAQALSMPAVLAQANAQVVHFSPYIRNQIHSHHFAASAAPDNRRSPTGGYWFTDLKQAYGFPSYQSLTGKGVKVGIVMASDYSDNDMTLYFGHENLTPPKIVRRPVFGGAPFDLINNGASFEVTLDIQQVGGMAPGCSIYLYNIPDLSDSSVLGAYVELIEEDAVDIVNSSFGGFEAQYTAAYNGGQDYTGILRVFDELFKQGNAQGITFVASSGDSGGLGAPPPEYLNTAPTNPPTITGYFLPGVENPASSPHVTAVGGTNLVTTYVPGSLESNYVRENADGDPESPYDPYGVGNLVAGGYWGSGGGKSVVHLKPDYQTLVRTGSRYRTIPDLSLHMGGCPGGISYLPCGPDRSYDIVTAAGVNYGVIGTSASAPDFAGLLALREEYAPGRVGNVNYVIYALAQQQFSGNSSVQYFRTGVPGFNGYYHTHAGYNLVLGNGTLFGKEFIGAPELPVADDPLTPSNP